MSRHNVRWGEFMNIVMQSCGLVILIIILYFFVGYKWIKLKTSLAFFRMLAASMVCTCLDIFSVFVLAERERFSPLFISISCKMYLLALVFVTFCALNYTYVDIYRNEKVRKKKFFPQIIILIAGDILILALPINWYVHGNELYTYGASVVATYIFALYFIWIAFHMVIRNGELMNARRKNAIAVWVLLWTCAAVIQFFIKSLHIVSFADALGVLVVYLMLENPDSYIDKTTGLYNQNAAREYVKQVYANGRSFAMYMMVLDDASIFKQKDMSRRKWKNIYDEFLLFLEMLPGAKVFCNTDDQILLFFDDEQKAREAKDLINSKINLGWRKEYATYANAKWFFVPDGGFTNDEYSFMRVLKYARQNNSDLIKKDTILVDGNMFEKMVEEKMIEVLIVDAIENNRIEVFYQPIYSTQQHKFISAEALVRLRDEKGEIVPPGKFIGVAEENGTILQLGQIVFEKVCRFISSEAFGELDIDYIEVNLSVVQCGYKHLASDYIRIMKKHKIEPERINLEITESASIVGKDILKNNMERLMDYGIKFSLDDFGTGHSNLNYIAEMPVEIVKFDRSMTMSYFESEKAKYVMNAAMTMIKGMELEIVSEGIETNEQYEVMERLGIDHIQGYYFSKPLQENEFVKFIMENNH